jgi:hypothetical protein
MGEFAARQFQLHILIVSGNTLREVDPLAEHTVTFLQSTNLQPPAKQSRKLPKDPSNSFPGRCLHANN